MKYRGFALAVLIFAGLVSGLGGGVPRLALAGPNPPPVLLDPGHGGGDPGFEGLGGFEEKALVLALCREVRDRLGPSATVILTREGDYSLAPEDRAGAANHARASVLVSVHAGKKLPGAAVIHVLTYSPRGLAPEPAGPAAGVSWDRLAAAHAEKSRALQDGIATRLGAAFSGVGLRQEDAPLAGLSGADMPAVLVDFDPGLFNGENRTRNLTRAANALAAAILDFLGTAEEEPRGKE